MDAQVVIRQARKELSCVVALALQKDGRLPPDKSRREGVFLRLAQLTQALTALLFCPGIYLVRIFGGGGPWPGGVAEDMQIRERQALNHTECPLELSLRLPWKADQHIAAQTTFWHARHHFGDQLRIRCHIVMSPHTAQNVIIAALQADMQVF